MTRSQSEQRRSVGYVLERARRRLQEAPFRPPTREAVLLLAHVGRLPEATVLAHPELELDDSQYQRFTELLRRRLAGEPVAYLLGEREFYGRRFAVDDRVLIPRPETEHLVETALELPLPRQPVVLDIGTGSGAIALTLALEIPSARLVATDCSTAALSLARFNRGRLGLGDRVALLAADLAEALDLTGFDLVVSNPPYISPEEASSLSVEITRFEPASALFAPPDGLGVVRRLLDGLGGMRPGTWLAMEIGHEQHGEVLEAARDSAFEVERVVPDLAGIRRVVVLRHH